MNSDGKGSGKSAELVELKTMDGTAVKVPKFAAKWFSGNLNPQQAKNIFLANGSMGASVFRNVFKVI